MERVKSEVGWISAAWAAQVLGTTLLKVMMLIKQHSLCGREVDGNWEVSRQSLEALQQQGIPSAPATAHRCGGCSACS